jgi:hypothetical protein
VRSLTPASYGQLFVLACLALVVEAVGSFPLYFAPGWANGWPGGLTIYHVWSTWLTITFFIMLMTIGCGAGSLISLLSCAFPGGRRYAGYTLAGWLFFWTGLSLATCSWAFREIYASTLEMWPNGYPA